MDWRERIEINPKIQNGKPVIKGTGLAVEFVLDLLAQGWNSAEIVVVYPGLTRADVHACLAFAVEIIKNLNSPQFTLD